MASIALQKALKFTLFDEEFKFNGWVHIHINFLVFGILI